ncbi:unnamed protein product [Brachionus calyciflorus]|uniref:Uncharacterized protein n=1 Tax=Brachionus calyciflorus TaxID=104777 RepID=A0A814CFT5_9BILA|nr:unnamed protein product [Brachionus calyciflorus]
MINIEQLSRPLESLREDHENEARLSADTKIKGEIDNAAKFEVLIDTVQTSFSEMQLAMQDLLKLKDELLLHFLPPPLLFKLAVVFGKVFRSYSDLNTPVTEMLRLVKIYSASWEKNSIVLKKIHDMYENKKQMLNIAIKRLAMVDKKTKLFAREKRVLNWEKLFIKLSESKGHGRRWKFQMDTFRKKADQGYDELIKWIMREPTEPYEYLEFQNVSEDKKDKNRVDKENKSFANDNYENSNLSMDLDKSNFSDEHPKKKNDENFINEVDSDQDFFSDASSDDDRRGRQKKQKKEIAEMNTQTEPDIEEKSTWTGEPDYTRYFIIRMFKPAEMNNKKIKFKLNFGKTSLYSKTFDIVKKVVIVDNKFQRKNSKPKNSKNEPEVKQDSIEVEKKIDLNKYEDFVFEMDDFTMKKEVLSTSIENSIVVELSGTDEKENILGYTLIQLDDIHTLDLPILYQKEENKVEIIEYETDDKKLKNNWYDTSKLLNSDNLIEVSVEKYEMLSKRTPMIFEMYRNKAIKSNDIVCKLPLMFFWVRRPSVLMRDKNTSTQSIRDIVQDLTGLDINEKNRTDIEDLLKPKECIEKACSPIPQIVPSTPKRPPSSPKEKVDSSIMKEKIEEIHEEYQFKIDELKLVIYRLENEVTQLKSLNEFKTDEFSARSKIKNRAVKNDSRKISQFTKSEDEHRSRSYVSEKDNDQKSIPNNHTFVQKQSIWTRNIPEGFYERLRLFNEKSYLHQKEIIEKYVSQEAEIIEQQMAVQHRLDTNIDKYNNQPLEDFCLPAVFMPFKSSNNVFNPRARQYFHPPGSDIRVTQPPSVFQLPPLPSKQTLSVINLFELGKRFEAGEPDYYINEYINTTASKLLNNQEVNQSNKEENTTTATNNEK